MRTEHRRGNSIQWVTRWQIGSQTAPAAWDAQRVKRVWGDFHVLCAQAAVSTLQPTYLATSIPGIGMFTGAVKTVAWARIGINTQTYHWGFTLVPEPTLPSYQSPCFPRTRAHVQPATEVLALYPGHMKITGKGQATHPYALSQVDVSCWLLPIINSNWILQCLKECSCWIKLSL